MMFPLYQTIATFEDLMRLIRENSVSVLQLVSAVILAIVVGLFIFFIYKICFRASVYSYTFNVALALMVLISTLIIITLSVNTIIISIGMIGTLSFIRFRTSLKDPIDIVYIIWATASGLAIGSTQYLIAIVGAFSVGMMFLIMTRFRVILKSYVIVVNYDMAIDEEVMGITSVRQVKFKSKFIRRDHIELTIEVIKDHQSILAKLNGLKGVDNVSLLSFED